MKFKKLTLAMMTALLFTGFMTGCADQEEEQPEDPATETPAEDEGTEETNE
ncbi:hypothetical protein WMO40_11590 [Bacillaceae bacterium CLA-AA-H227]|uniref:Uncharacterized protein n=1 Tax=Robertmurraya yapensis (ex Hitch et al 2024) TaxID=3133160 RepID=A0ACC6SE44_9BACI|nr:hypothetical protein [Bacillus yapensis]